MLTKIGKIVTLLETVALFWPFLVDFQSEPGSGWLSGGLREGENAEKVLNLVTIRAQRVNVVQKGLCSGCSFTFRFTFRVCACPLTFGLSAGSRRLEDCFLVRSRF